MATPESSTPSLTWDTPHLPRSSLYGDLYFSADDGLGEARAVFLAGCDLPNAWQGRSRFCVAELGFGMGLNIVALLDLWRQTRPPGGRLHIFTIDAHPVLAHEAARALARWPQVAPLAAALVAQWPGRARGFHAIGWPDLGVTLDLAVMEVTEALRAWSGQADAWFLDGFAPARNPAMWRDEVLDLVAARSAPGARLATYSVAGSVRRGLGAAGFALERRPGFGRKRGRLEGRFAGCPVPDGPASPRVAVVGAGIAGASLCRAFRNRGLSAQVFDAVGAGAGASGGPAALAAPRLDAGLGPAAALFAQAMRCAVRAYDATAGAVIGRQALQLAVGPKDPHRFAAIAGSDLFETDTMRGCDAATVSARLGEPSSPGLTIAGAVVVDPPTLLAAWLEAPSIRRVAAITPSDGGWRLVDDDGRDLATVDIVCVAAGMESAALLPELNLTAVRGQADWTEAAAWPVATLFGGYVVPTRNGVMFGATHDRGDVEPEVRADDHGRNLATVGAILPGLAARLANSPWNAHTGIRATTSDYLPLAGALSPDRPGLFVLTGLGSRGYCLAPLLAEYVAAAALGAPSPLPLGVAALIDPARFATRARRKGRGITIA